ncbi:hypothetical protein [Microbaculum marinum]|uniref:Uncharacterized protein n=1 Tax=Microbaculum marinum TaxID=1764581 RepID=A0AAW9RV55_9HYPH
MSPRSAVGQLDRSTGSGSASAAALTGRVRSVADRFHFDLAIMFMVTAMMALAGQVSGAAADPAFPDGSDAGVQVLSVDAGGTGLPPVEMDGTAVVSYVTPSAAPAPAAFENAPMVRHWTLRDSVPVRTINADVGRSEARPMAPVFVQGQTGVAVFSWREIVFAALIVAFALGALLALTGGGDSHRTRNY